MKELLKASLNAFEFSILPGILTRLSGSEKIGDLMNLQGFSVPINQKYVTPRAAHFTAGTSPELQLTVFSRLVLSPSLLPAEHAIDRHFICQNYPGFEIESELRDRNGTLELIGGFSVLVFLDLAYILNFT